MKLSAISKGLLLGLALLMATSAFAANKGTLSLSDAATVAGKELKAGEYTVQWEGAGPSVQVNILKNNKVVATVPAKLTNLEQAPGYNSAVVTKGTDGSRTVAQIRFSGKKTALDVSGEGASASNGSSSN